MFDFWLVDATRFYGILMNPQPNISSSDFDALCVKLGLQTHQGVECLRWALANIQLIDRKQLDYGPNNILMTGETGCAVRSCDKVSRLLNLLLAHPGTTPANESIEDSWRDLANYATIALVVRGGLWLPKS